MVGDGAWPPASGWRPSGALLLHYLSIDDPYVGVATSDRLSPDVVLGHGGYVVTYLGGGLLRYSTATAAMAGVAGLTVLLAVLLSTALGPVTGGPRIGVRSVLVGHRCLTALVLYSAGSAALTALGRWERFGSQQALASRYVTFSNFFWIVVAVVMVLAATGARSGVDASVPPMLRKAAPLMLGALVMVKGYNVVSGQRFLDTTTAANDIVCQLVTDYPDVDQGDLAVVSAPQQPVSQWMAILHTQEAAMFREDSVNRC